MPTRPSSLYLAGAFAGLIALAGCDGYSSRGDYPDHSVETTRKVDDIKRNARDQKDALERTYDDKLTNIDFRQKQVHDKARGDREALAIENDKTRAGLVAKKADLDAQAKHDQDKIDLDAQDKLRASTPEQIDGIKADALSRKAEIERKNADKLSSINADLANLDGKYKQKKVDIDLEENKAISDLQREQADARNVMREKKLEVDRWESNELTSVNKNRSDTPVRK